GDLATIDIGEDRLFESLDPNGVARDLWTAADAGSSEQPFAVAVPEGSGSVVLLASDAFLANRSIGAHDHALAAVRLAEDLGRGAASSTACAHALACGGSRRPRKSRRTARAAAPGRAPKHGARVACLDPCLVSERAR